jgi:hypothetical protein
MDLTELMSRLWREDPTVDAEAPPELVDRAFADGLLFRDCRGSLVAVPHPESTTEELEHS